MNTQNIHEVLVRFLIGSSEKDVDTLAAMLLLHTHRVKFSRCLLEDRPTVREVSAITRRHAAEAAASAWRDRCQQEKWDPRFWFSLFNSDTPYEVVEEIPQHWMDLMEGMREKLVMHPDVSAVEKED